MGEVLINDLRNVKEKVASLLERHKELRDDDKKLYLAYLKKYTTLREMVGDEVWIVIRSAILNAPSFESIRRTRQKFQEEGEYLGTEKSSLAKKQEESEVKSWSQKEMF